MHEARVREQLARWRDDLLDLTGRNRLLRFRHTKTASLELESPDAQAILDRLLDGRSREWTIHIPADDAPPADDLDPTAERIALGPADRAASDVAPVAAALDRLGGEGDVWVSFGVLRWQHDGTHAAALFLVPAEIRERRLRLKAHELRVNPALVAHFEREFELDLGDGRYRIESAGIQSAIEDLRRTMAPLNGVVDDRIGLIAAAELGEDRLDVTPGVLLVDGPREGVLAGLAGAEEGLPLIAPGRRVLGVPLPSRSSAPVITTTKGSGKDVRAACAGLSRRAAGEFMDRGIWVLYLGVGMLHWSDPADGRAEFQDSPLMLVPVRLEAGKGGAEWKLLPTEEESLVNPALWLKLESELGIELPELDPEEPLEVAPLLEAVRAAVAEQPQWAVEERVVLSTFSFHKEAMYRDLRDNFEQIAAHPIVSALAAGPAEAGADFDFEPVAEEELDEAFPPEQAVTILDADASQRQCVAAAREGRSFVMDGPPGTGKSQTIANMIAELITHGKTVLFVSEKAAALDVVHSRLAQMGLDEYVLELHSHKTTRAAVAAALGASLLRHPKPNPALTAHDLREAARQRIALSRYADAMNAPDDALGGRSLHHLLGRIAALAGPPPGAGRRPSAGRPRRDPRARRAPALHLGGRRARRRLRLARRVRPRVDQRGQPARERRPADARRAARRRARRGRDRRRRTCCSNPPPARAPPASSRRLLAALAERPEDVPASWLRSVRPERARGAGGHPRPRAGAPRAAPPRPRAGPRWRELAPRARRAGRHASSRNRPTRPSGSRGSRRNSRAWPASLAGSAAELAALLGLRASDLTLAHAEAAVELAGLEPVPARWLADGVPEQAIDRVAALLDQADATRAHAQAFEPAVLDLDLEGAQAALRARAPRSQEARRRLSGRPGRARRHRTQPQAEGGDRRDRPRDGVAGGPRGARRRRQAAARRRLAGDRRRRAAREARPGARKRSSSRATGSPTARASARSAARRPTAPTPRAPACAPSYPMSLLPLLEHPLSRAAEELRTAGTQLEELAALTHRVDALRGQPGTTAKALDAQRAANAVATLEREHDADDALEGWAGLDIDADALEAAVAWAARTRALLPHPPGRAAANRLVTVAPDPTALDDALARWDAARDTFLEELPRPDAARRPRSRLRRRGRA